MTDDLHVVVLAAGKGTRMRSALPKVLHRAAGVPVIEWVIRAARSMRPHSITIVLGHGSDEVREWFADADDIRFVIQEPQLGTGHALLQAERVLTGRQGTVLLLSGDAPLITKASLEQLVAVRREHRAAADRRGSRRHAGRARHHRNQQRHLRVRPHLALRGPARSGHPQCAGRVLPA